MKTEKTEKEADISIRLLDFIKKSPSCFHAVKNICRILRQNGFSEIKESEKWKIAPGGKYFTTRNSSSVAAFAVPKVSADEAKTLPFMICASHSDSPSFKIKENPEIESAGCVVLNVEKYGGMLINPWFDRPLSVAGRVIVKSQESGKSGKPGALKEILVDVDKNLLMIPNLAIHMDRDANNGRKIDVQSEIRPVLSLGKDKKLLAIVAENAGIDEKSIVFADLFLYNRSEPCVWGAENEFISSPKLDDLECAFSTLEGFVSQARSENEDGNAAENSSENENASIKVYSVFDNEEVGSQSRQGAASTFLSDTLSRISFSLGANAEDFKISLSKSFMVSADNAHAVHPNYVSCADPVNRPKINGGVVIKFNAAQKYTSDALSAGFFKSVCQSAKVPFQIFTNNSNVAGGSTLGNISQTQVSVPCVDIGLAQWAMHSPYETAGAKDAGFMARALCEFYGSRFFVEN